MGLLDDAIREHLELKRRRGADAVDISREESEALGPVRRGPDGAPDLSDTTMPGEAPAQAPAPDHAWEGEQTEVLGTTTPPAEHAPPPPSAVPPAPVAGYEPPPAPAYVPPAPAHEPPPTPPPAAYEPPPPRPAEPERPWFERAHEVPEQEGEDFGIHPEPSRDPEPEPEHTSLLGRLRVGRKHKDKGDREPAPFADEPAGFEPPPLPGGHEPASAYEPPPAAPSYGYQPPAPQHEPDIVPADDEPEVEDVLEETPDFLEETPEHDRLWFEQRPPRDFDFDDK
jgi:hypothetical protein